MTCPRQLAEQLANELLTDTRGRVHHKLAQVSADLSEGGLEWTRGDVVDVIEMRLRAEAADEEPAAPAPRRDLIDRHMRP